MALDTYEGLKAEITDWTARPELSNKAETFIALFESGVWPLFQGWEDTITATVTTTAGTALQSLPSAARTILAIDAGEGALVQSSHAVITGYPEGERGRPRMFVGEGETTVRLAPIPDSDYTLTVTYTGAMPKLSALVTSNWLLQNFPQLYLYGSLVHAKRYMQDVDFSEVDSAFAGQLEIVRNYVNTRRMQQGSTCWSRAGV